MSPLVSYRVCLHPACPSALWERPQLLWDMSSLCSWGWFCSLALRALGPQAQPSDRINGVLGAPPLCPVLGREVRDFPVRGAVSRQACSLGASPNTFAAAAGSGIEHWVLALPLLGSGLLCLRAGNAGTACSEARKDGSTPAAGTQLPRAKLQIKELSGMRARCATRLACVGQR